MLHRIREKISIKKIISMIPTAVFLVFVYYMMIRTYTGDVKEAVEETTLTADSIEELTDSFENVLESDFYGKNNYINLNGLVTNILDINSLNVRQKLANGYLTYLANPVVDTTEYSDAVIELNDFLNERGIDFTYLLVPSKSSFYDADFSQGYSCDRWQNIDTMIDALDAAGVSTIDMDAWFEENNWDMEDVFFKTDHHWKPSAALAAAGATMELLVDKGIVDYEEELFNDESWTVTTLEDWFLGSHGRRVGVYYAGVDDIDVYIPNFETNYSFSTLLSSTIAWKYYDNPLNLDYTEKKNYFDTDPYCIYLYGNRPIQVLTNSEAVNDKKVLIIGDSFKLAWEYFMSTQFQEIYSIDTRLYKDGTLAEYIEEIQPDIVIMCAGESNIDTDALYDFGVEEYMTALEKTTEEDIEDVISLGDVSIEAQEDNGKNFEVLYTGIESNQAYTMTLDSTSYTGGDDLYIQVTLQDLSTNKAVYNRYFDANSEETQKWIFTTPDDSEGVYAIYVYAGVKGYTQNVSVEVSGIKIQKGICEE